MTLVDERGALLSKRGELGCVIRVGHQCIKSAFDAMIAIATE